METDAAQRWLSHSPPPADDWSACGIGKTTPFICQTQALSEPSCCMPVIPLELHVTMSCKGTWTVQDCLEQVEIGMDTAGLPDNVAVVPGPRSQREVRKELLPAWHTHTHI